MSGSSVDARRDPRIPARLRVVLVVGGQELSMVTEDISLRGLRVRTDVSLPPRRLVRLRLPIGEDGSELSCQGMIVHGDPSEVDGTPTLGIQFYAFDGPVREAWTAVVASKRTPAVGASPPSVEPVRRQLPRKNARITVYIGSMEDLIAFTTVNVSRGGMFLATTTPLPVGAQVRLEMKSEETNPFAIDAIVRRVDRDRDPPGMAVEFVSELDDARFDGVGEEDEAPVFVTLFDPNLA